MGRPLTYDAWTDVCEDVSLDAYLADHQTMPHLFDLVLPTALGAESSDVDVAALAAIVRSHGEPQCDVRLLVIDPEQYLTAASELADTLRCDVYLPPPDAQIRYLKESSSITGESWDALAVRGGTSEPTPWLVVRPAERTDDVPTWFVSTGGRLRQNNGLITVPLSHGLAFATAATFPEVATLARHITAAPPGVTTLAVTADLGRFEISRFSEASALLGGVEFATLVAASLDLIEPDIQLALAWPADAGARATLDVELMRLADALDRTVWVPRPSGCAVIAASPVTTGGEFAAVDEQGRPSTWHAYASRLAMNWRPNLVADAQGRLAASQHAASQHAATQPVAPQPGTRQLVSWQQATAEHLARQLAALDPIAEAVALAERSASRPVFMPASPTVLLATLGPRPPLLGHCVSWLSPSVVVNQDPVELYVWIPPAHAKDWVVSSPDVFLLADSDPARLAARTRSGQLLRLSAPARTAVELSQQADQAPAGVRRRILDSASTHLLPLAWISRYQVTAQFDVDSGGEFTNRPDFVAATIDVRFDGAEHGILGLPNEVVNWPGDALRSDTPSYLVIADGEGIIRNGFAALTRQAPVLEQHQRVLEIRVRRRRAIDVPATLGRLAALPMAGRLQDFAGFDVLLSEQDFARAVVSKVWRCGPGGEPLVDKLSGDILSDLLARTP